MAKKEYTYKGKTEEELKQLDVKQFAELTTSRERRSLMRGFDHSQKKVLQKIANGKSKVKTHSREMVILPQMIGRTIAVYTGRKFEDVNVTMEMVGKRLGDFASSTVIAKHSSKGLTTSKKKTSIRK